MICSAPELQKRRFHAPSPITSFVTGVDWERDESSRAKKIKTKENTQTPNKRIRSSNENTRNKLTEACSFVSRDYFLVFTTWLHVSRLLKIRTHRFVCRTCWEFPLSPAVVTSIPLTYQVKHSEQTRTSVHAKDSVMCSILKVRRKSRICGNSTN